MKVDHKHLAVGPVFELMPRPGWDDHNVIFTECPCLAVEDGFDLSIENDKCLLVGMTMFLWTLPRREADDEERDICAMLDSLKGGNFLTLSSP